MAEARAHVVVSGLVQGVYFRYSTREKAKDLGLTGWVRNLPTRQVEAVFEGEEAKVEEMIEWCRRGPAGARVDKVDVSRGPAQDEFLKFEIVY